VFFFNKFIDFQNCNNQVKFEKWRVNIVNVSFKLKKKRSKNKEAKGNSPENFFIIINVGVRTNLYLS
jgi:hypothetical protein